MPCKHWVLARMAEASIAPRVRLQAQYGSVLEAIVLRVHPLPTWVVFSSPGKTTPRHPLSALGVPRAICDSGTSARRRCFGLSSSRALQDRCEVEGTDSGMPSNRRPAGTPNASASATMVGKRGARSARSIFEIAVV